MFRTYQVAASGPDVHHDTLLSNIAVMAFDTGEDGFVVDRILPAVPVGKQSDRYAVIDKGEFLRRVDAYRAPRTEARRVEFKVSSDAYFAKNYALAAENALEDLDNADNVFQLRENSTKLVTGDLRRAQEIRVADRLTSISNVGSGVVLAGANQWSDYVNSDPLGDVNTGHAFIQHATGLVANTGVVDFDTFQILQRHPDLLDMYKYTNGGLVTQAQIAAAFKVGNLWVAQGVVENALEGGVSSMTQIWGRSFFLCYVGPATGLQTRTFGLRYQWRPPSFPAPFATHTKRYEGAGSRNVEVVQAEHYQDERVIARDLSYLLKDTVAA